MGFWDENLFKLSESYDQSRSIYGTNLQKSPSLEQETDDLETWHTAPGTQVLPYLFN